jgi:hypothetical protein
MLVSPDTSFGFPVFQEMGHAMFTLPSPFRSVPFKLHGKNFSILEDPLSGKSKMTRIRSNALIHVKR